MMVHPLFVLLLVVVFSTDYYCVIIVANSIKNLVLKQIFIYFNFHDFYLK